MTDARWVIGVDIGGTNLVVGAVPASGGEVRALVQRPTEGRRGAGFVIDRVATMVRKVRTELEGQGVGAGSIAGVGIGSPGPLDRTRGVVLESPNLGWENLHLRDLISQATGLPATLDNDANCAIYGEWWRGAGRGFRTVVGVTIGTGVGGGILIDGQIYHGASGAAGEIGHTTIDLTGRRCGCGNYGCLEAYASGPNIAARAVDGIEAGIETALTDLVDGDLARITAATVYTGAASGDAYASEVLRETAQILGAGIANLVNVINPEVVIVGGGVTRAGDHLVVPLRAAIRRRAFRSASSVCEVRLAELGDAVGVIGAAGVFLNADPVSAAP